MHFNIIFLVTVGLIYMFWQTEASEMCYKAKTCFHNGKEKCGVNGRGEPRRFLDSCDLLEYNCLMKTDYVSISEHKCAQLPKIERKELRRIHKTPDANKAKS